MVINNQDPKQTAFTVSVDVKEGTTTGISAFDRAATFRALASPTTVPGDFNRPGHVFPLRPREGGVLERDGHTEAAIDYMRLAGLQPAGILAEVCNDDGTMARIPQLLPFCEEHGLVLTSIADLIAYLDEQEQEVGGSGTHADGHEAVAASAAAWAASPGRAWGPAIPWWERMIASWAAITSAAPGTSGTARNPLLASQ